MERGGEPPDEESHSAERMAATTDRPRADRTKLPLLSCRLLLQERERHYRRGSQTRGRPEEREGGGGTKVPAGM